MILNTGDVISSKTAVRVQTNTAQNNQLTLVQITLGFSHYASFIIYSRHASRLQEFCITERSMRRAYAAREIRFSLMIESII